MVSGTADSQQGVSKADIARRVGAAFVLVLAVTAVFRMDPIRDAVTGAPVAYAEQTRPLAYLVGAPLFGIWDSLSLVSLTQHYAILATLLALYVGAVSRARRWTRPGQPPGVRMLRQAGRAVSALALLLLFYGAGILLPRPMTGLRLTDEDLLAIDFHSHTRYSHDAWGLFTPVRNRAWHEAGGFDVAYVTDHYTWAGFDEADRDNPERVGERTALLSGAEIRLHRRPTNALGDRSRYLGALDADSVYMDPEGLIEAYRREGRPPTLLYTMPGGLQFVVPFTDELPYGVIGIEIVDASPRGLEQVRAERREIVALADSLDLALLGATNLHGWGRTVASWSVMEIPRWQDMTPEEAGDAIEETLHRERRDAVRVVERRMPHHEGSPFRIVATLPWLTLEHFRMLALDERASWLIWIVVVVAGVTAADHRRVARDDG